MANAPTCSGTEIPVQVGDEILWFGNDPGTVVFVIGADEWRSDFVDQKDWYRGKFGSGIMIETEGAGLVLESEVDAPITLVKSSGSR